MIRILDDAESASRDAAREVVDRARRAVEERDRLNVALAGGHTPRRMYELLATEYRDEVPWDRVRLFWGDERCVPPDDPRSNYAMAREAFLERVPVPPGAVHRIPGELGPDDAAARYHELLTDLFGAPSRGGSPGLDLVILGAGEDGHTASLFPEQLEARDPRWARGVRAPAGIEPRERVTLTLRALNSARGALFLAFGPEKRPVVAAARAVEAAGAAGPADPPATHVRPAGGALWIVDRPAAEGGDWTG